MLLISFFRATVVILLLDREETVAIVSSSPLDVVHLFAYDAFKCAQFLDDRVNLELFLRFFFSIHQVLVLLVSFEAAAFAPPLHVHPEEETAVLLHVVRGMDHD